MKNLKEMNKEELMNHMFALLSEVSHLRTLVEPHDTGHIITTISMLEHRIKELKDCLQK